MLVAANAGDTRGHSDDSQGREPRRPDGEQANEKGYVRMAGEHGGMKDGVDGS